MLRSAKLSSSSSRVMRYPDSVKNTETPRKPPVAQPNPAWNAKTAMTASARTPSSDGR